MSAGDRSEAWIDERELAAALRDLRPDPAAFRAAVERRLREAPPGARERGGADGELHADEQGWLRRAAGWLPGELVPASLAGAGAKVSWKALPALIALPALTFAMLAAPVVLSFQTLGAKSGERAQERLAAVRGWWHEHRRVALAVLALIGLVFLRWPTSAGATLLIVSTGVLALLLARLRAAGFGWREDVGRHCAHLLLSLVIWMALFGTPWRMLFASEGAAKLGIFVLVVGVLACGWLQLRERHRTLWHLLTRSNGEEAVLLLSILGFVPMTVMGLATAVLDRRGPVELARHVAELRPEDREGWEHARDVVAWMRREGVEPDLGGLRAHWLECRDASGKGQVGFLAAGIELGFLAREELGRLSAEVRGLLDDEGPITGASLREHAGLFALVHAGSLSEAERDRLAQRLVASRDAGPQPWVLERFATVAALLDRLGRSDLADALRPDAHALLLESWVAPGRFSGRGRGGFFARRWHESDQPFAPHTHDALDLMLRYGVPAGIDLEAVARGLERDERLLPDEKAWDAVLALAKLERLSPERRPLAWLGANVVLVAMLFLTGFCVAATLRAPRRAAARP